MLYIGTFYKQFNFQFSADCSFPERMNFQFVCGHIVPFHRTSYSCGLQCSNTSVILKMNDDANSHFYHFCNSLLTAISFFLLT